MLILQFSQAEVPYIHEPRKNYCLLSTPNDLTLWDISERHFFQQFSDTAFWQVVLAELGVHYKHCIGTCRFLKRRRLPSCLDAGAQSLILYGGSGDRVEGENQ